MSPENKNQSSSKQKLSLPLDLRAVVIILLAVIVAMLVIWKPWDDTSKATRTVQVTGEATLKSTPDEFVFYPSYQFDNTDKATALGELTKKSGEIVAKLKELGVQEGKIKTNAANYDVRPYNLPTNMETATYTLSLTVTAAGKDLAQKVQDYLLRTAPSGSVTPQPAFSTLKRKKLETQARAKAEKDARTKAEQSATNLGFSLGKVKSVSEGVGFGDIIPLLGSRAAAETPVSSDSKLAVQPGENELSYNISVTYFIK